MSWAVLNLMRATFVRWAALVIMIGPIIADFARAAGMDFRSILLPIIGAMGYFLAGFFVLRFCPREIATFKNKDEYALSCLSAWKDRQFRPLTCFAYLRQLPKAVITARLKGRDELYPLERALDLYPHDAITEYAKLNYEYLNFGHPILRHTLSLITLPSILLMNWFVLSRFARIFGSAIAWQ